MPALVYGRIRRVPSRRPLHHRVNALSDGDGDPAIPHLPSASFGRAYPAGTLLPTSVSDEALEELLFSPKPYGNKRTYHYLARLSSTITRDKLYEYSNGRFLVNETGSLERRYLKFNLDGLCPIAARVGIVSPVNGVNKMEGGFSKALIMTKQEGTEVVAKLPFAIAGPAHYTTASEVAVLKYGISRAATNVHQHTKIPVPKVLAWSSDPTNFVGAEYVVMEKAVGTQMVKRWSEMPDYDHFMFIEHLCALESELASVKFPAHGSLYLRESMRSGEEYELLEPSIDPTGQFCIDPSCERAWNRRGDAPVHKGPWSTLPALGHALVQRELCHLRARPDLHTTPPQPHGTVAEQIAMLQMSEEVIKRMDPNSLPGKFAWAILWHTDLHLGNIYVSDEDPTQIVSIIDWQSSTISPLFCQVRFPEFLDLGDDYEVGGPVPRRRDNLEPMDQDDRQIAEYKHKEACMGKAYEAASGFKNKSVYKALQLPEYFKDLVELCGEVSDDGVVPLRACLIEVAKVWKDADLAGECPINFTNEELAKHNREFEEYSNFHQILSIARKLLGTDSEGWISPAIDIEAKRQQNRELMQLMMERSADYGATPEQVLENWRFKDASSKL